MATVDNQIIASLREEYTLKTLLEDDILNNPITQFKVWFEEALKAKVPEPNIMTLATVKPDGSPSARIVLLKGITEHGFTFFTNYASAKGMQMLTNNKVALVFCWLELQRQVRIEGSITQLSQAENDEYFYSRPKESQLGAIASPQSQIIASREILEQNYQAAEKTEITRPETWGGYLVTPNLIEFWQGRSSRLHDRIAFTKTSAQWEKCRLAP